MTSLSQVVKLLVGNKVDKERVVTRAQAEEYARSKGMLFLEARWANKKFSMHDDVKNHRRRSSTDTYRVHVFCFC